MRHKLAEWIEDCARPENVEFAVIGEYSGSCRSDAQPFNDAPIGVVLPWDKARAFLLYEFDAGYGSPDCHPVIAWTATKVITIMEYDGAVSPAWFPRNPTDVKPTFDGVDDFLW